METIYDKTKSDDNEIEHKHEDEERKRDSGFKKNKVTAKSKKLFFCSVLLMVVSAIALIVGFLYLFFAPYVIELATILLSLFGTVCLLIAIVLYIKSPYKVEYEIEGTGFIKNDNFLVALFIVGGIALLSGLVFEIIFFVCHFDFALICWLVFWLILFVIAILIFGKTFCVWACFIFMCVIICIEYLFIGVPRFGVYKYGEIFYDITSVNAVAITSADENSDVDKITIPNRINGRKVTAISYGAFKGHAGLTCVTIPDSVTRLGSWAFDGCSGLVDVAIGNGITSIDYGTFQNCISLTNITIPDVVTSIGSWAFDGCSSLENIDFGGTTEQWKAISKDGKWDRDTGNYTVHCTDGDLAKE